MNIRLALVSAVSVCGVLAGCGGSDSKAEACAAWDAAIEADAEFMSQTGDPVIPDTGDIVADTQTALDDLQDRMNVLTEANKAAKEAFTKAAADDSEWEPVQEAAYLHFSSGGGQATVNAACDRLSE